MRSKKERRERARPRDEEEREKAKSERATAERHKTKGKVGRKRHLCDDKEEGERRRALQELGGSGEPSPEHASTDDREGQVVVKLADLYVKPDQAKAKDLGSATILDERVAQERGD
jgi:hypothetical protein